MFGVFLLNGIMITPKRGFYLYIFPVFAFDIKFDLRSIFCPYTSYTKVHSVVCFLLFIKLPLFVVQADFAMISVFANVFLGLDYVSWRKVHTAYERTRSVY